MNLVMNTSCDDHQGRTELKKREKGVPGYGRVLDNKTQTHATYNMIKSEKLNVYTIEQTKVALSNFDG